MGLPATRQIGRFELIDVIGQGGMGIVYKAVDTTIGRTVAIKMLHAHYAEDEQFLARFYREVRSTATLQHKNIVTVYGLEEFQGSPYMILEYLEGQSMAEIIASHQSLHLTDKIGLLSQVCEGLQYAHARQVIHRDIKPANILVLPDGTAKIVDFGIARGGLSGTITRTGMVIGSVSYMSPEQITGGAVDSRTDIYSAGITLYQLIAGELPFTEGKNESGAILVKILNHPAPPLSKYLAEYPLELDEILSKALAKNPDTRYQTAEELGYDLSSLADSLRRGMAEELLKQARRAMEARDWERARQQLQEVLKIDGRNREANDLFRSVRDELQRKYRSGQIQQLRTQSKAAMASSNLEEALSCAEHALHLNPSDEELVGLVESVKVQIDLTKRITDALRRGNAALIAGDLADAQDAVRVALELKNDHPEARSLERLVKRELNERARKAQYQALLEEARREISEKNFLSALQLLKKAQAIDPADSNIRELLNWAARGYEHEKQRADLQQCISTAEKLLDESSYVEALAACEAALAKFPDDSSLLKLRAVAVRQCDLLRSKEAVDRAAAEARSLTENKDYDGAIQVLSRALAENPGESSLAILLSIVQAEADCSREEERDAVAFSKRDTREIVAALEEGLARGLDVRSLRFLAERMTTALETEEVGSPTTLKARSLLEAYESRIKDWENACKQMERSKVVLQTADTGVVVRQELAKAKAIAESFRGDEQIRAAHEEIRQIARDLDGKREEIRKQVTNLLQRMQGTQVLGEVQAIEQKIREISSFWREDTTVGRLITQASLCVDQVRRLQEHRIAQVVELSESLLNAHNSGQIRVIEEQASILGESSNDPDIVDAIEGVRNEAKRQLKKIDDVVAQLNTLAQQIDSEATLIGAKARGQEAALLVSQSCTYEETREILGRIEYAIREREREYGRIERALKKLVETAGSAPSTAELDSIVARRGGLVAKYAEEPIFGRLGDELQIAVTERRTFLSTSVDPEGSMPPEQTEVYLPSVSSRESKAPHSPVATMARPTPSVSRSKVPLMVAASAAITLAIVAPIVVRGHKPTVDLRVIPAEARVSVDGQECGNPCILRLVAGKHQMTAKNAGFQDLDLAVSIPWFGKDVGPFTMSRLPITESAVSTRSIEVPPVRVSSSPSSTGGRIAVETRLPNVAVFLDGRLTGHTTSNGQLSFAAADGTHEIRLEKQGYTTDIAKVSVHEQMTQMQFQLQPLPVTTALKQAAPLPAAPTTSGISTIIPNQPMPVIPAPVVSSPPRPEPAPAPAASIKSFNSSASKVTQGETVTLTWDTANASEVSIEQLGPLSASGTKQLVADRTTTFKLIAKGNSGAIATATVHLEVSPVDHPTVVKLIETDRQAIDAVLAKYQEAYDHHDIAGIQHVWPTIPNRTRKNMEEAFKQMKSTRLTNSVISGPEITGSTARIQLSQTIEFSTGKTSEKKSDTVTMELRKAASAGGQSTWYIDRIQ